MASCSSENETVKGAARFIAYTDESGSVERKGCPDKAATEGIARKLETEAARSAVAWSIRRIEAYRDHQARPLCGSSGALGESPRGQGSDAQARRAVHDRARRVVALIMGAKLADIEPAKNAKRADIARADANLADWIGTARLSDLTAERVQKALATLQGRGPIAGDLQPPSSRRSAHSRNGATTPTGPGRMPCGE